MPDACIAADATVRIGVDLYAQSGRDITSVSAA